MFALLFIIGLVVLFFLFMAIAMARSANRLRMRWSIIVPCFVMVLAGCAVIGGLLWAHYTPPPASEVLAVLEASANLKDRPTIIADLQAHGFPPVLTERPFANKEMVLSFSPDELSRGASYLLVRSGRVRPHDLFAEYVVAVYLFDAQGQLITWSNIIDSQNL